MGQASSTFGSREALQIPLDSKFVVDTFNNLSDDEYFWAQDYYYDEYPGAEDRPLEEQLPQLHQFAVQLKDVLALWRIPHVVRGTRGERPVFVYFPPKIEPARPLAKRQISYQETYTEYEDVYPASSLHSRQISVPDNDEILEEIDIEFAEYDALTPQPTGNVVTRRTVQTRNSTVPNDIEISIVRDGKRHLLVKDRRSGLITAPPPQVSIRNSSSALNLLQPIPTENRVQTPPQPSQPKLKSILKKHREPTPPPRSSTPNPKGILKPARQPQSTHQYVMSGALLPEDFDSNRVRTHRTREDDSDDDEYDRDFDTDSDEEFLAGRVSYINIR